MYGVATGINDVIFKWEIRSNISDKEKRYYSFISIPRALLLSDIDCNISLIVSPISGSSLMVYIILTQTNIPNCQTPVIEFLDIVWLISEYSCFSDNYPLKYQFGCLTPNKEILWLTVENYMNSVNALIFSACEKIIVEVCNGLSCKISESSIIDGKKQHWDIINDYFNDILNSMVIQTKLIS